MTCAVPYCPAEAADRATTCVVHKFARLAKGLPSMKSKKCETCKRALLATDWIYQAPEWGNEFKHVACEPIRRTARSRKDEPKPLFDEVLRDDSADHSAA